MQVQAVTCHRRKICPGLRLCQVRIQLGEDVFFKIGRVRAIAIAEWKIFRAIDDRDWSGEVFAGFVTAGTVKELTKCDTPFCCSGEPEDVRVESRSAKES